MAIQYSFFIFNRNSSLLSLFIMRKFLCPHDFVLFFGSVPAHSTIYHYKFGKHKNCVYNPHNKMNQDKPHNKT